MAPRLGGRAMAGAPMAGPAGGVQPVPGVRHVPLSPTVEQTAGDTELPAGPQDVAPLLRPRHDAQTERLPALVVGPA